MSSSSSPRIILVCGYRRHGKDTLFRVLNKEETSLSFDEYYLKGVDRAFVFGVSKPTYIRVSFASILKQDVADILGTSVGYIEERKDNILTHLHRIIYDFDYVEPEDMHAPTYRDVLINHAARCRSADPAYYPKRTFECLKTLDDNTTVVVTDWRYNIEYAYACDLIGAENIRTVRVYNPKAGMPAYNVHSEHKLDDFITHALLQPKGTTLRTVYTLDYHLIE